MSDQRQINPHRPEMPEEDSAENEGQPPLANYDAIFDAARRSQLYENGDRSSPGHNSATSFPTASMDPATTHGLVGDLDLLRGSGLFSGYNGAQPTHFGLSQWDMHPQLLRRQRRLPRDSEWDMPSQPASTPRAVPRSAAMHLPPVPAQVVRNPTRTTIPLYMPGQVAQSMGEPATRGEGQTPQYQFIHPQGLIGSLPADGAMPLPPVSQQGNPSQKRPFSEVDRSANEGRSVRAVFTTSSAGSEPANQPTLPSLHGADSRNDHVQPHQQTAGHGLLSARRGPMEGLVTGPNRDLPPPPTSTESVHSPQPQGPATPGTLNVSPQEPDHNAQRVDIAQGHRIIQLSKRDATLPDSVRDVFDEDQCDTILWLALHTVPAKVIAEVTCRATTFTKPSGSAMPAFVDSVCKLIERFIPELAKGQREDENSHALVDHLVHKQDNMGCPYLLNRALLFERYPDEKSRVMAIQEASKQKKRRGEQISNPSHVHEWPWTLQTFYFFGDGNADVEKEQMVESLNHIRDKGVIPDPEHLRLGVPAREEDCWHGNLEDS